MSKQYVPTKIKRRHKQILVLFTAMGLVNSFDRATLAMANPMVRHDLHISIGQMGLLLSAFFWAYAITQLPLGPFIDRFPSQRILGCAVIFWSVMQGLTGLAGSFRQLFTLRLLLGVGEAPQLPTCAKTVRAWFGPRERGRPLAVVTGSQQIAAAIAAPMLTGLMLSFGWRWMFTLMGLAGLISGAAWFLVYRDPETVDLSGEEKSYIEQGKTNEVERKRSFGRWYRLLTLRTTWGVLLGFIGFNYANVIYSVWLPGYLEIAHHLSIARTGLIASVPLTFGILGSFSGGAFADLLARRGLSPMNAGRIPCIVGTLILAVSTMPLLTVGSLPSAILWLSIASWGAHISGSSAWVLVTATAPQDSIGSLGGMHNCFGAMGGAVAAVVTGYIVEATHSFVPALLVMCVVAIASALAYLLLAKAPITAIQLDPRRASAAAAT